MSAARLNLAGRIEKTCGSGLIMHGVGVFLVR
jgi:hypothetical protein